VIGPRDGGAHVAKSDRPSVCRADKRRGDAMCTMDVRRR